MEVKEILDELKTLGNENTRKIFFNHGAQGKVYGVKVEDLKKIKKKVKKNYSISKELYNSGISDAMYLAGLIADETKMTKEDLQQWVEKANWYMISEYTVPWIAAESNYGWELAIEWIDSSKELIAAAGWSTLSSLLAIKKDEELDINALKKLLIRVSKEIFTAKNRVKYAMNAFVISLGAYVAQLTDDAIKIGAQIGKLSVDMGGTACKVPYSPDYINKVKLKGTIGKKKKMARC